MSMSRNRSREAMNVARKTRNKGGYISQFRSNLTSTVAFFEGVHLNNAHLECLKRTPFFNLVLPFAKHKVTSTSVTGTPNVIVLYIIRECFLQMPLEVKEAERGCCGNEKGHCRTFSELQNQLAIK
ncbi:hypothetical protein ACP275_14G231500 [Erythranthe tilingii]